MKYFYLLLLSILMPLIAALAFAEGVSNPSPQSMGVIAWIVAGLIVGFVANPSVNKTHEGIARDIAFGMIGAWLGERYSVASADLRFRASIFGAYWWRLSSPCWCF